jgi:hypothetical protein
MDLLKPAQQQRRSGVVFLVRNRLVGEVVLLSQVDNYGVTIVMALILQFCIGVLRAWQ